MTLHVLILSLLLGAALAPGQSPASGPQTAQTGPPIIIDRLAAVVGKHAIKTSDIERQVKLTEFLNREPLNLDAAARQKATEHLVDQAVISDAIKNGGYPQAAPEQAEEVLAKIRDERFGGSDARLREALAGYGLTEAELKDHLQWQLTVLRFIDERFRPEALISNEDVRAYYDQHLAELKRIYPGNYSFTALEPKVRSTLEEQRIDQRFDQWLDQARKRTRIEYRQEALR